MCHQMLRVRVTLRQQGVAGLGEAFGGISFREEAVKAKITMKPHRDCRLGGGEKWREREEWKGGREGMRKTGSCT